MLKGHRQRVSPSEGQQQRAPDMGEKTQQSYFVRLIIEKCTALDEPLHTQQLEISDAFGSVDYMVHVGSRRPRRTDRGDMDSHWCALNWGDSMSSDQGAHGDWHVTCGRRRVAEVPNIGEAHLEHADGRLVGKKTKR